MLQICFLETIQSRGNCPETAFSSANARNLQCMQALDIRGVLENIWGVWIVKKGARQNLEGRKAANINTLFSFVRFSSDQIQIVF